MNKRPLGEATWKLPLRFLVGSYVISLEAAGCSLTISLLDESRLGWGDAPVYTGALRWGP
jgi:dihydroxyacetone kinase-like protein